MAQPTSIAAARQVSGRLNSDVTVGEGQISGAVEKFVIDKLEAERLIAYSAVARRWIRPYLDANSLKYTTHTEKFIIDVEAEQIYLVRQQAPALYEYLRDEVVPGRLEILNRKEMEIAGGHLKGGTNRARADAYRDWQRWAELRNRRPSLMRLLDNLPRYLVAFRRSPLNGRLIVDFVSSIARPSEDFAAIALADDYSFGVLSSEVHQAWMWTPLSAKKTPPPYDISRAKQFPWPATPSAEDVERVRQIGAQLLNLRSELRHHGSPLEKQYVGSGLEQVASLHKQLDEAVYRAYTRGWSQFPDLREKLRQGKPPEGYPGIWSNPLQSRDLGAGLVRFE